MKFKHILFLLFITLSLLSCSNNSSSDGEEEEEEYTEEGYQDGTYCAEVDFTIQILVRAIPIRWK